jgi:hypothetical protein
MKIIIVLLNYQNEHRTYIEKVHGTSSVLVKVI